KFGMSGSLKDGKANIMQYIGMFGSIFKPVSTRQLIDDGQVSKLKINSIFLRYSEQDVTLTRGIPYADEVNHITAHTKRNAWICRLALKLAARDENVVVFFKHIKHGKKLFEALKSKHGEDKVVFISGDVKTSERNEMKHVAENSTGLIVVASYGVMSTGISIKNLHHLIFAHPVKSAVIVLQSLGRVLRKHASKDTALLWDIIDDIAAKPKSANSKKKYVHLNYAYKHGLERIEIYNRERHDYNTREIIL
ncbi:MAG: helicase-related protein, partial [Culicoidibacterales bacterium]